MIDNPVVLFFGALLIPIILYASASFVASAWFAAKERHIKRIMELPPSAEDTTNGVD